MRLYQSFLTVNSITKVIWVTQIAILYITIDTNYKVIYYDN